MCCYLPYMDIGDRIRAARQSVGLSQRALAEKIGVDKSAVAQWEGGGGGKGIKIDNLIEVARVLQIRPSQLLGDAAPADAMALSDPREIAVVSLFRRLSRPLQDVHLQLLYAQTGTEPGDLSKLHSAPGNRKRVRS